MHPPRFRSSQALQRMSVDGQYLQRPRGLTLLLSLILFAAPLSGRRRLLRRAARARRAARLQD